jgi:hypothetical protein
MMQLPPDIPFDPNMALGNLIPIVGMLTGVVISGFVALGPVGRAIGDVIRHWLGGGRKEPALQAGDVDEIVGRLEQIQHQISELAERQDFAERVLAQARKDRPALGGADVAG